MSYCTGCGDPCRVVKRDYGIGSYEFWGTRGFDRDVREVSACCEDETTDVDPREREEADDV